MFRLNLTIVVKRPQNFTVLIFCYKNVRMVEIIIHE